MPGDSPLSVCWKFLRLRVGRSLHRNRACQRNLRQRSRIGGGCSPQRRYKNCLLVIFTREETPRPDVVLLAAGSDGGALPKIVERFPDTSFPILRSLRFVASFHILQISSSRS